MGLTDLPGLSGTAPVLSGLAAFAAVIAVVWPYLERDRLGERLAHVAGESERLRRETRGEMRDGPRGLAGLYEAAARRVEALRRLPTAGTARKLQMAGLRGPSAVMAYLALRGVAGAGLFVGTFLYLRYGDAAGPAAADEAHHLPPVAGRLLRAARLSAAA